MPPHPPTILVVDDNVDGVDALSDVLETYGYRVHRAYSGREALAVAAEHELDVAIIDVNMPSMDGVETARQLTALARPRDMRLIAYTGSAAAPVAPPGQGEPFEVVISKGASIDVLIRVLEGRQSF